jgi:regulator of CtrA degradation
LCVLLSPMSLSLSRPFETDPVSFAETFVLSEAFRELFREGMGLVEETAAYLDGAGREESRLLPRYGALAYASESMRLTTRLMQIASWLLVHRAVAENEITTDQARNEKNRVKLTVHDSISSPEQIALLPESLRALIDISERLHARIMHLDVLMSQQTPLPLESPVSIQHYLLQTAFGRPKTFIDA